MLPNNASKIFQRIHVLHPERILSQRPLSITLQANKDQEISTKVKENERKLIQIKTKIKDDTSPKHLLSICYYIEVFDFPSHNSFIYVDTSVAEFKTVNLPLIFWKVCH